MTPSQYVFIESRARSNSPTPTSWPTQDHVASGSHAHGGGGSSRGTARRPNALGLEHAAIPQQGIEDAGEATGEGDHGHLFSRARGDAHSPGPQLLRPGAGPGSEHGVKALRLGPDAPLDDLAALGEDVDLSRLCTSMPIWSMAGLSSLRR
jgi:hypothetical protein